MQVSFYPFWGTVADALWVHRISFCAGCNCYQHYSTHFTYFFFYYLHYYIFFYFHAVFTYLFLFPYLPFPLRIDPLRFQAWCRKGWLNLALDFCVCFVLCYISFDCWMHAFVMLGLVFSILSQEIGLGKHLWNDLFCVEWDVKPQLDQGTSWSALSQGTWPRS